MITVAYYTRDSDYETEARILCASLDRAGMAHDIEPIDSVGDWFDNTALKAEFIRRMREKHAGPMLYVDVDAFVHSNCDAYFDALAVDFATHWFAGPSKGHRRDVCPCVHGGACSQPHRMLSGTLFFGDTSGARRLIAAWCRRNFTMRASGERQGGGQKNLWHVTMQALDEGWLTTRSLPGRFCFVFDKPWAYPSCEPRIIEHTIASRDWRPHDDGRPKRPGDVNQARRIRRAELARMANVKEVA